MSNNDDIFLVIKHIQRPAKGEKTHMKNWKASGRWETYEEATITDNLKNRLVSEASVIINISQSRIEKNRNSQLDGAAVKNMYLALMQKYQENIAQFYARYRPDLLASMIRDRAAQESIKKGEESKEKTQEEVSNS